MSGRRLRGVGLVAAVCVLGGCAGVPTSHGPTPTGAECRVAAPSTPSPEEPPPRVPPLVAMAGSFDPRRAPIGRSDAETLLLATLHRPLVGVDCLGRLAGGLASAWRTGEERAGELRWILDLPGGNAADIAEALASRPAHPGVEVLRVEALDEGRLAVVLRQGREVEGDGVRVFTLPSLIPVPQGGGWVGSFTGLRLERAPPGDGLPGGPRAGAAPRPGTPRPPAGTLLHLLGPSEGGETDEVLAHVQVVPGADPRDLLDAGAQLMITRDMGVRGWAQGRPDVRVVALPPDRVHLLVVPSGGVGAFPGELTASLAREVVEGNVPDVSWSPDGGCPAGLVPEADETGTRPRSASRRLVYAAHDPVAGALAARLVALTRPGGPMALSALWREEPLRAVPLAAAAFETALRGGDDAGYLLETPRTATSPCVEAAGLTQRIPWLDRGSMVPLVETGAHLLLRAGAPEVEVDASGAPRLVFPRARR